jgi:hypothetical protein
LVVEGRVIIIQSIRELRRAAEGNRRIFCRFRKSASTKYFPSRTIITTFPYHRIVVIGATGCGKSTLAQKLAQRLDLEYIELDALYWKPNWVESSDEEFYARVEIATRAPRWALAGNYRAVRELVWSRAEAVIWLDYPLLIILGRLLRRILKRWLKKELLWGTNYESFWPI